MTGFDESFPPLASVRVVASVDDKCFSAAGAELAPFRRAMLLSTWSKGSRPMPTAANAIKKLAARFSLESDLGTHRFSPN
jgi:hypothetical protein